VIKVAISGGFDPVHIGHIKLIKAARKLGDKLVVILNNDNFLLKKKGFVFMPLRERKEILESITGVDEVFISHDKDLTVCKALSQIKPDIFANGGDRLSEIDIPERETCKRINCKMIFGVGGRKIQSSSWLVGAKG